MGMFAGKIGLIMGVANDRSIAWAISQALYAEGAELAFTHLPSPSSERRVRELVGPHGPKIVLPCDVQKDADIARVFDDGPRRLRPARFSRPLDRLRPAAGVAQALRRNEPRGLAPGDGHQRLQLGGREPGGRAADDRWRHDPDDQLLRRRKSRARLQHDGRLQGGPRAQRPLSGLGLGPAETSASTALAQVRCAPLSAAGIAGFDQLREHAAEKAPLGRNVDPKELGTTGLYLLGDLSSGVTGETIHLDCGYSIVGL